MDQIVLELKTSRCRIQSQKNLDAWIQSLELEFRLHNLA